MKNKYITFFIVLIVLGFVAWSGYNSQNDINNINNDDQTNVEQNEQQNNQQQQTNDENANQNEKEQELDIKIDSGRFIGQIDSNFIEVKISGVPDEMDPRVFMLSDEVKDIFDSLNLKDEDTIKFKYYINENEQNVIVEIEKI